MTNIKLSQGSGGKEMDELIRSFGFSQRGNWKNCDDDAASLLLDSGEHLIFTTDSFVISPIFFPGGDIGHVAVCGTINDLLMMGAQPLGISLGLVIVEGFSEEELSIIINSIKKVSADYGVPVVTGDTKVMPAGKLDGIIINCSGIGKTRSVLRHPVKVGDSIIVSGSLGDHAVALLSKRFEYKTSVVTDSKPLIKEMDSVRPIIKAAKDPTRGGLSAVLHEFSRRYGLGISIEEGNVPIKTEVSTVTELLGLNVYEMACEGRMVCISSKENAGSVVSLLKKFNADAAIIGEFTSEKNIVIRTSYGNRILPEPSGRIVPRIC